MTDPMTSSQSSQGDEPALPRRAIGSAYWTPSRAVSYPGRSRNRRLVRAGIRLGDDADPIVARKGPWHRLDTEMDRP